MESNKILQADILDILFEDRNKEYGAYQLRKTYNKRLFKAIIATGSVILLLFAGGMVMGRGADKAKFVEVNDITLDDVAKEKKVETPPVTPPPVQKPEKVEIKQFTPPKVVPDEQVKKDERPPEQTELDDVKIGNVNQEGVKDDGITAPPTSDNGKGIVEAPKRQDDLDVIFTKVEVESSYPGGGPAWLRFLNKNLRYPEDAINNEIQGAVVVQFIVDKEGNVSDVQAVSGPEQGGLREEAIRAIKKSGKWVPAIQNGNSVKSYKRQPITFQMPQ